MGFIPKEVIDQVLDRSDIVELIGSYIPLRQAGRHFKAPCPFHQEKTPSFVVTPDKQIFHCFGCGAGGNAISFVMRQERLEFPEAVRMLAERAGIPIPEDGGGDDGPQRRQGELFRINERAAVFFHDVLLKDRAPAVQAARDYLKSRGVSREDVGTFQLGFAPDRWDALIEHLSAAGIKPAMMHDAGLVIPQNKQNGFYDRFRNRIMFPIFDTRKRCVAFGARTMEKDNPAKYVNSPETALYTKGEHLYGLHLSREAVGRQDAVVVVEGYMDFIMPFRSGFENIVASLGTALTVEQIRLLRRHTRNVVMLYDADPAGQAAMVRSLDLLIDEDMDVRVATLSEGHDPDSFIRAHGVEAFRARLAAAESLFDFKLKFLAARYGRKTLEQRMRIIQDMLPTIRRFSSTVAKVEYTRQLAQALAVSQEALLDELKEAAAGERALRRVSEASVRGEPVEVVLRPAERDILRLMLREPELIPTVMKDVAPEDFQGAAGRKIVARIYEMAAQGEAVSAPALLGGFAEAGIVDFLSGLMTAEDFNNVNAAQALADCLQRLRSDQRKLRLRRLRQQMDQAQGAGDQQQLDELIKEFNQLIKGNVNE